jgi:hypothetical protein
MIFTVYTYIVCFLSFIISVPWSLILDC